MLGRSMNNQNYQVLVYADIKTDPERYQSDINDLLEKAKKHGCTIQQPSSYPIPFISEMQTPHGTIRIEIENQTLRLIPLDDASFITNGIVNMAPFIQLGLQMLQDVAIYEIQAKSFETK